MAINPNFPTDSAPAPRIRSLRETRIRQPSDGLGPAWRLGEFDTGDQIVFFLETEGASRRDFIQGVVLRVTGDAVRIFFQDNVEETHLSSDFHLRNAKPEGIDYIIGDPVWIQVHDPANRLEAEITQLPDQVGAVDTFEVQLVVGGGLVLTPLSHMVLRSGRPNTIPQVQAFGNVQ